VAEAARTGAGSGAERGDGRETASPMVLHCVVGEEVAATFGEPRIRPRGSLFLFSLSMSFIKKDRECNEHLRQKKKICGAKTKPWSEAKHLIGGKKK
jgi:hypothetical protein